MDKGPQRSVSPEELIPEAMATRTGSKQRLVYKPGTSTLPSL